MKLFNPCSPCCGDTLTCEDFTCPTCNYVLVYCFNFETPEWSLYEATGYELRYNNAIDDILITTINPAPTVECPKNHFYVIGNLASHCEMAKNELIADFGEDCVTEIVTTDLENLTDCISTISLVPDSNGEIYYYSPFLMILKYCDGTCCYSKAISPYFGNNPLNYPPTVEGTAYESYFDTGALGQGDLEEYDDESVICTGTPLAYFYGCSPPPPPVTYPLDPPCPPYGSNSNTLCSVCDCCNIVYTICADCPTTPAETLLIYGDGCGFPYCTDVDAPLIYDYIFDWCGYSDGVQQTFPITSGFTTISSASGTFERRTVGTTATVDFCFEECMALIATYRPETDYPVESIEYTFSGSFTTVKFSLPLGHAIEADDVVCIEYVSTFDSMTYSGCFNPPSGSGNRWLTLGADYIIVREFSPDNNFTLAFVGSLGTLTIEERYLPPAGPVTISFDDPVCAVAFGIADSVLGSRTDFFIDVDGTGGFSETISDVSIITSSFNDTCTGNFFEIRSSCPDQKINSITIGFEDNSPFLLSHIYICAGF